MKRERKLSCTISSCYGCRPHIWKRELHKTGDKIVDINGLPFTLNFLESKFQEIADTLETKVVNIFATTGMERMWDQWGSDCPEFEERESSSEN